VANKNGDDKVPSVARYLNSHGIYKGQIFEYIAQGKEPFMLKRVSIHMSETRLECQHKMIFRFN